MTKCVHALQCVFADPSQLDQPKNLNCCSDEVY
jgi:hypothetical protein